MNELHDLAAPYALDALDEAERADFEAHLAACPACRAEVAALQEGASLLAMAGSEPAPAGMRARVLADVDRTPQDRTVLPLSRKRRFSPGRVLTALAAAMILLAGFAIGLNALTGGTDADDVLAAPDVVTVDFPATDAYQAGPVEAAISWSPSEQKAVVTFAGLADVGDDQTYELWVIDERGVLPAGLFRPAADGRAVTLVDESVPPGATIAITVEPAGGVDVATGEVVFAGSV